MKFTTLEPLNQRFNEALKEVGLTRISKSSNSQKVINKYLSDSKNITKRIFDDSNETCSQILIKENSGNRHAVVLMTDDDSPEYDSVFIVE